MIFYDCKRSRIIVMVPFRSTNAIELTDIVASGYREDNQVIIHFLSNCEEIDPLLFFQNPPHNQKFFA